MRPECGNDEDSRTAHVNRQAEREGGTRREVCSTSSLTARWRLGCVQPAWTTDVVPKQAGHSDGPPWLAIVQRATWPVPLYEVPSLVAHQPLGLVPGCWSTRPPPQSRSGTLPVPALCSHDLAQMDGSRGTAE